MINEEIRKRHLDIDRTGRYWHTETVDILMNEARTDERNKVIEEIDNCISDAFKVANDGAYVIRAINLKLSQLKEQK